ncbi:MAG: hypothetical protein COT17_07205, partial [Elusimicrobia bacterium CG08_land_8_20_14_0_20_51_18]
MKAFKRIIISILLVNAYSLCIWAAPNYINYQGRLIDTIGNPLAGTYSVTFKLYDAASSGSLLWSETQSVTTDNGIFSAALGSSSALPAGVFANDSVYLEIQIGAETLSPRTRLYSAPYARYAANLGSASEAVNVSTDIVLASQLQLGSFAGVPAAKGAGALIYDSGTSELKYYNGSGWLALGAGGLSPWSSSGGNTTLNNAGDLIGAGKTPAEKLDVAGNIKADYGIIASTGVFTGASGISVVSLNFGANIMMSSATAANYGGIYISTNVYIEAGAKYYGDGSSLSGILPANNSITNAMLQDSAVTKAKIAQDSCTDGQVLKISGTAWSCGTDNAGAGAMTTKEGDVSKVATTSTLDFEGNQFGVTESPVGEANVVLKSSTVTLQGNSFNTANKLVQLDGSGKIALTYLADGTLASSIVASSVAANGVQPGSIVAGAITDADINASAAIAKSKLAALSITNSDLSGSAGITDANLAQIATADKV